jgi:peptide/histidine transporter 3/4
MNTKLGSLKVPSALLHTFPVTYSMVLAPVYNHLIIPFVWKATKSEMGSTHLQHVGIGLALSTIAMAVAALVEIKRKRVTTNSGYPEHPLPVTSFWSVFSICFLGR